MKRRFSKSERQNQQKEALNRATQGISLANYPAIFEGFMAMGIPEEQIIPRVNVFTYAAAQAAGFQVRKGEHGVKIVTWIEGEKEKPNGTKEKYRFAKTTTVFHTSQMDRIGAKTEVETVSVVETSECRELICV